MSGVAQQEIVMATAGRGLYPITAELKQIVRDSGVDTGLVHVFIHHTSASLLIMENADPDVLTDLETWMSRAVVDGDPEFRHRAEGPDDMSAHIRSALTHTDLTIPVREACPDLGTWQGVYVWEHRTAPHRRRISVCVVG